MSRNPLTTVKISNRIHHIEDQDGALSSTPKSTRPKGQSNQSNARRKVDNDAMDCAVDEWLSYTTAKAAELAQRFDKKPRYFLDRFFLGGSKLIYKQSVTNPYNAFKSIKAAELRAEGERENVVEIHKQFKDEYQALLPEARAEYVAEFEALKSKAHVQRHTSRGCIQDVGNIARNMEKLLEGLKNRVGIEGFFCIVRNNTEFHVNPIWYFTSKEISEYMPVAVGKKWSATTVASKLEAFAIAGCDVINMNRTSQQKANHMKREITNIIAMNLISITGNDKVVMQYANYEAAIIIKYGVELVGWTHEKFCNPSELSNALEPLRVLLDALNNQVCKFVKLSPAERRAREAKYKADVASGTIVVKQRKTRKDTGTKRKGPRSDLNDAPPAKRIRSADTITDSDNEATAATTGSMTTPSSTAT